MSGEALGTSLITAGSATSDRKHLSKAPVTPTVFVVDDDISVRESIAALVTYAGWQVATFASTEELFARPVLCTPSCFVIDVSLRDRNGFSVLERIPINWSGVPVIFITGHRDFAAAVEATKGNVAGLLVKPLSQEPFLTAIRNALASSPTQQER